MLGQENWLPNNLINTNFNQKIVQKTSQAGFELVEGRLPQVKDKLLKLKTEHFHLKTDYLKLMTNLGRICAGSGTTTAQARPSPSVFTSFELSPKSTWGVGGGLGTFSEKMQLSGIFL